MTRTLTLFFVRSEDMEAVMQLYPQHYLPYRGLGRVQSRVQLQIVQNQYGEFFPTPLQGKFLKVLVEMGILSDVHLEDQSLLEALFYP
jgi:hypothetical protein